MGLLSTAIKTGKKAAKSAFSEMNQYDMRDTLRGVRDTWPFHDDIGWEELMDPASLKELKPEVRHFVNALWKEDGLGFDYPSQAISAALSEDAQSGAWEMTPQLKASITNLINSAPGQAPAGVSNYSPGGGLLSGFPMRPTDWKK
jgi:hypothetical protein